MRKNKAFNNNQQVSRQNTDGFLIKKVMKDLIGALQIFMKYCGDVKHPTTCEHEELFVNCVKPEQVSKEDLKRLDKLGFLPYEDFAFVSYRFGDN